MIVIVGAGLAGLICARELERLGVGDYLLLEAEAEPGGRVRSAVSPEGFVLDRGFQVLLDSYPAVTRHLDIAALHPRYLESGARLHDQGETWTMADPRRHPLDLPDSVFGSAFPFSDKWRLVRLVGELLMTPDDSLLAGTTSDRDCSTAHFLWMRGFSPRIIERFFRPFFGGVFLDDPLGTSAALFRYYLKKFAAGRTLLPARGIGEIPRQLAAGLSAGKLRPGCRVERLELLGHGADALRTTTGERIAFDALLLATDAPATARLLDRPLLPTPAHGTTTVYFASTTPLYDRAMLTLPAGRGRLVRHFIPLTNAAPEYAPPGQHLLSVTVLDRRGLDDTRLYPAVRNEIAAIYPAANDLRPVAVVDVPYAQHLQPAGFGRGFIPAPAPTFLDNVWLAGDQTGACSIQSAMVSGERSAAFLVQHLSQ